MLYLIPNSSQAFCLFPACDGLPIYAPPCSLYNNDLHLQKPRTKEDKWPWALKQWATTKGLSSFNSFFQGFASATETPTLHSIFSLHDMRLVQLLLSHNSWLTLCYFLSFCFFWMLFSTQEILWCYTSKSNTRCYSETLMLFSFLRHPTVGNSPVYSVTQHHHDRRCKKKGRHSHVSEKGNFIFIGTVRCQWQRNEQNRQSLRLYLSQFCAAFR